ncbi:hypothetical protein F5883DRAFT_507432 [Diaporthe sp. PMI_573]|nr:hypothetical protein F5883DRAFT_507432 [Diaporthaceae sp. PMI_573]
MPQTLQQLLSKRAKAPSPARLLIYPLGESASKPTEVSYSSLYQHATRMAIGIRHLPSFEDGRPILLHLEDHWDAILWFWAVLLAGGVPVMSAPFSNLDTDRHRHIEGLSTLLESPLCLTRSESLPLFHITHGMCLHTIEPLVNGNENSLTGHKRHPASDDAPNYLYNSNSDLAMLMLTSGSTGNAKAVRITHRQVLASVAAKASMRPLPPDRPFLNWIGMDHVAGRTEIHLHALWLGVDQVHIRAADIVTTPRNFVDLLSRHRVSYTFAPNFFLAKLVTAVAESAEPDATWDLSNLVSLVSGGEANDIGICEAASAILEKHGAHQAVITPGFGMTETCAGAIYNLTCPSSDVAEGRAIASLGRCTPGIEIRVVVNEAKPLEFEGAGDLEVRGRVVFEGYYRNVAATKEAFTADGWFRTGDLGIIDPEGNLCLVGRTKDVININGLKMPMADIQTAVERALGNRIVRLVVFPSRMTHTEQVTIAYVPQHFPLQDEEVAEIAHLATQVCLLRTMTSPRVFALRQDSLPLIPVSTLGKISRPKMRRMFDDGKFAEDICLHEQAIERAAKYIKLQQDRIRPANMAEALLMDDFAMTLNRTPEALGMDIDTTLFEAGFTSMHVLKLKFQMDKRLCTSIQIINIMKHPTARGLAALLGSTTQPEPHPSSLNEGRPLKPYDPVVVLRATGSRTPLWLIHPGVGEILVFIGLAQHIAADDRPVYAMRPPGFEPGQEPFGNITEAVDAYTTAIQARQPRGPYALAGYSYGAMLAFETAKRLGGIDDGKSEEVRFLGSFNLPPHIKNRMRQLSWNSCLLHLANFVGLVTEEFLEERNANLFCRLPRAEALECVIDAADKPRLKSLGLGPDTLARWADVSFGLQRMATEYDPSGQVDCIDVFHCIPLKAVAGSREEWMRDHLIRWADFTREPPRFHSVGGEHYTMIGAGHVEEFVKILREALKARGL